MSRYGYRLFAVELHRGQKRSATPLSDAAGEHYLDVMHKDVTARVGENFRHGINRAALDEDATPVDRPDGSVLRFTRSRRVAGATRVWTYYGAISNGLLIDPDGEEQDTDISGRALSHNYRAALIADDSAELGILGVEVNGRTCPRQWITRSLSQISGVPWRLKTMENIADAAAVRSFLRNGKVRSIELIKHGVEADGQRRDRTISLSVSTAGDPELQETIRERLMSWYRAKTNTTARQDSERYNEANELAFIAVGSRVGIDFEDTVVTVEDDGRSRRLRPASDYGKFVYDLGDHPLPDDEFFEEVETTAGQLLESIGNVVPTS